MALVGTVGTASVVEAQAAPTLEQARSLIDEGRYAEAEAAARSLLSAAEATNGPDSVEVADVLDVVVEASYRAGKAQSSGSQKLAERAVGIKERALGPQHPGVAQSLNNLATILSEGGDRDRARPLLERALAIRESVFGSEHPSVALSLNNLANLLSEVGDYAQARSLYERALAIREKTLGPHHRDVAQSLNNLAIRLSGMGDYAAARPLYERALAVWENALGPDHPWVATALNNLSNLHRRSGDYAAARPLLERSLAIRERVLGPDHDSVAIGLNNLATLFRELGDYVGAKPLFERAFNIRQKTLGSDHPEVALSLNNLADLLAHMGDRAAARPLFERSLTVFEKALGPEHPYVAVGLYNLASLLEDTGDLERARSFYERSLAIREKAFGPGHPSVAQSLDSLGRVLALRGEREQARPRLERALAIREKALGAGHPEVAQSLRTLASLLAEIGETDGALEAALRTEGTSRDHLRLTALTLSERQALRYASVRVTGLDLALTLAAEGLGPAARKRVWDALVRSRAVVLDEMAGRHRTVGHAGDAEIAPLADRLRSARSRLANLTVRGPGAETPDRYRKLLEESRQEKEQAEQALAAKSAPFRGEQARNRIGLEEIADALPRGSALVAYSRYDRMVAPHLGSSQASRTASNGSVAEKKAPGSEGRSVPAYLAFVLRSGGDAEIVPLGTAERIDPVIEEWRGAVATDPPVLSVAGRRAEARYREIGVQVRRAIWDPLMKSFRGSRQVFVVPDGALHLVSLATLPVGKDGYLVESGPLLHYLSAEKDLVRPGPTEAEGSGLLLVGSPDFAAQPAGVADTDLLLRAGAGARAASRREAAPAPYRGPTATCETFRSMRWEPLPGSRLEVEEVASLWRRMASSEKEKGGKNRGAGDVVKLTGAQATEPILKRLTPGRRVLHLATHGFVLHDRCRSALEKAGGKPRDGSWSTETLPPLVGENPLLLAGLVLAGANHREASAGEDTEDGILTAEEIASLDLSGVEWAVLSACETGVGRVQAGEGVLGLRRAFEVAGARTLIMTLWRIKDEPARQWMGALYEGRLQGLSTASAARRASLEMITARRRLGLDTHPFSWGAFVAAGDWR